MSKPRVIEFAASNAHGSLLSWPELREQLLARVTLETADLQRRLMRQTIDSYSEQVVRVITEAAAAVDRVWREALPDWAEQGWYLDLEMTPYDAGRIAELFRSGRVSKANSTLVRYFDRAATRIGRDAATRFPARRRVIASAISAHRQKGYMLAIPVLLAQADGICAELLAGSLFSKRNQDRANIETQLAQATGEWAALLEPLRNVGPVTASTRGRTLGRREFNRHASVHGLVSDYGTHLNRCKALSLLGYIANLLGEWHAIGRR